jgi:hypothetical protein
MSKWRAKALELFPDMRSEIQSAESIGRLWIELMARFERYYGPASNQTKEPSSQVRATALYASWCSRSESLEVQEPAHIEFYEYLPRFALQCSDANFKRIIRDLVRTLGIAEIEKMGCSLKAGDLKRFLATAKDLEEEARRLPSKRR